MGQANYSSSKAGLIGLTKATAREVASRGITCNAVAPGFVVTELTKDLPASLTDQIKTQTPLGRFGTVDEIASAVTFLASDEAGIHHGPGPGGGRRPGDDVVPGRGGPGWRRRGARAFRVGGYVRCYLTTTDVPGATLCMKISPRTNGISAPDEL